MSTYNGKYCEEGSNTDNKSVPSRSTSSPQRQPRAHEQGSCWRIECPNPHRYRPLNIFSGRIGKYDKMLIAFEKSRIDTEELN